MTLQVAPAITDPATIKKILRHLGLATKPPAVTAARGPPDEPDQLDLEISVLSAAGVETPNSPTK